MPATQERPAHIVRRRRVRAWLRSKDPEAIVGRAGNSSSCPLAEFIKEDHGATSASVSNHLYSWSNGDSGTRRMTRWMRVFIRRIDSYSGRGIRARTALRILTRAEQEAGLRPSPAASATSEVAQEAPTAE